MEFEIIEINWLEKNAINLEEIKNQTAYDNCLYQTYGDSPIYGRDSLLYIGQTNSFLRRTGEHLKSDFQRINNPSFIVGQIDFSKHQNKTHKELLDITESLLITMLKPSYNSSNIKDTGYLLKGDDKYLILNLNNRGVLPLEITNIWW